MPHQVKHLDGPGPVGSWKLSLSQRTEAQDEHTNIVLGKMLRDRVSQHLTGTCTCPWLTQQHQLLC